MESIFTYICQHADQAHWIIFCLLLLAGLNIPISEDIMLLSAGAIASTCIPDHAWRMYIWLFVGCYVSAWEAYWLGRLLGPKLFQFRFFKHVVTPARVEKLRSYLVRFGIFTFIFGRFCPGGVRNALFMSSGLTKMPFWGFILRDGIACLLSSSVLFYTGYRFGEHLDAIVYYVTHYNRTIFVVIGILVLSTLGYLWYKYRKESSVTENI